MKSLFSRNRRPCFLFLQNPGKTLTTFLPTSGVSESSPASVEGTPTGPSFAVPRSLSIFTRGAHTLHVLQREEGAGEDVNPLESVNATMSEFLSRFVFLMRGKVSESYPHCNKDTINGMLSIIVQKVVTELERGSIEHMIADPSASALATSGDHPHGELSDDLWATVWEASNVILGDMRKERKREEMKKCLQSEDVKGMCRFARDVGVRGDMLREMRLKWAEEKFSEREFYRSLERLKAEYEASDTPLIESSEKVDVVHDSGPIELPQRHGEIKYKVYGLDMSEPKWGEVADRLHDAGKILIVDEPKPITGKCKLMMQKLLSLDEKEDPSKDITEWKKLLEPGRVDWLALLEKMNENNPTLYYKVAELILDEESFDANIQDYLKLIDGHAKMNRLEDVERILKKMEANGIAADILTHTRLIHIYSKAGNLERAKTAFENIRSHGFRPDSKAYNSMIMAYVNAGEPRPGEALMREMEARDIKPTKDIYMALLRSFAQRGHVDGAQRIVNTMQFAGFQPDVESCTLLVEAYGHAGDPDQARNNFDFLINTGHKPDDRCTASMISAYERKNMLDKAVALLLDLEKGGFKPGIATYTVLVDWFGQLQLIDEAEQMLKKISGQGKAPFSINVSLCDMYARAGNTEKALKALDILEGKKEELGAKEFERIILGLLAGGLRDNAEKLHDMMKAQGHPSSETIKISFLTGQVRPRPGHKLTFSR